MRNPRFRSWSSRGASRRLPRRDHGRDLRATPRRRSPPCRAAARTPSSPPAIRRHSCRSTRPARSPRRRQPRAHGARADDQLALPQRARAAVRRPARPPGAELRDRSPARGRARGRQRPRGACRARSSRRGCPATRPTCPYTATRRRRGGWSAPDLARARRLVAASGTRGARVRCGSPEVRGRRPLRRRGPAPPGLPRRGCGSCRRRALLRLRHRHRHHAQVGFYGWIADFLTPSSFFESFSCARLMPHSSGQRQPLAVLRPRGGRRVRRRAGRPAAPRRTRAGPPSIAGCWRRRRWSPCSTAAPAAGLRPGRQRADCTRPRPAAGSVLGPLAGFYRA